MTINPGGLDPNAQNTKWYLFCPKYASWIAFVSIGIYGYKKCTAFLERQLALSLLFTAKIVFGAIYEWKSKRLEGFQIEKKGAGKNHV